MTRDAMTAPPRQQLHQTYAAAVPELSVPWQADPPARPELAWLNEELARELGYEPQWLRSPAGLDRKSTRLNSSHVAISYAVSRLKKKTTNNNGNGSETGDDG